MAPVSPRMCVCMYKTVSFCAEVSASVHVSLLAYVRECVRMSMHVCGPVRPVCLPVCTSMRVCNPYRLWADGPRETGYQEGATRGASHRSK